MNYQARNSVINKLEEMGYFKYVPQQETKYVRNLAYKSLENDILADSSNIPDDDSERHPDYRLYSADNENLAEEGIGLVIQKMKYVLEKEGVHLETIEDDYTRDDTKGDKYNVVINGTPYQIFTKEMTAEITASGEFWTIALRRLLEIVNELLEKAGSSERLFGLSGGNDGMVIFLTNNMYEYIKKCGYFKMKNYWGEIWLPYPPDNLL